MKMETSENRLILLPLLVQFVHKTASSLIYYVEDRSYAGWKIPRGTFWREVLRKTVSAFPCFDFARGVVGNGGTRRSLDEAGTPGTRRTDT